MPSMEVEPFFSGFQLRIILVKADLLLQYHLQKSNDTPCLDSYAMVPVVALTATAIVVAIHLSSNSGPLQSFLDEAQSKGGNVNL